MAVEGRVHCLIFATVTVVTLRDGRKQTLERPFIITGLRAQITILCEGKCKGKFHLRTGHEGPDVE
jgi:hypothetical protein